MFNIHPLFGRGAGYDVDSLAYFNAMTTQPDETRKGLLNDLIRGLKDDGVWSTFDHFSLLASHDQQSSRINAKNPSLISGVTGSINFTANLGVTLPTGGQTAIYYTTPNQLFSGNMTGSSASIGYWVNQDSTTSDYTYPFADNGSTVRTSSYLYHPSSSNTDYIGIGSTGYGFGTVGQSRKGLSAIVQLGGSTTLYRNNTITQATNASVSNATPAQLNYAGSQYNSYANYRIAIQWFGSGLTTDQMVSLYNRMNTYLIAIGAK